VDLSTDLQPDAWHVRADRGQFEQVLVNLAVNARDAMPSGGRLSVSTANVALGEAEARRYPEAAPGDYVRIRVVDTGTGMTPEVLARVFEPFYTTKEQGKGTGLGLSTVYGIVRQSQGFVNVRSAPGAGTTFDVYLPREVAPPVPRAVGRPGAVQPAAGEVVLVVEDEEQVRSLVVSQLLGQGFAVLSAADGREALRIAEQRRERIDVLLSDVVMPRMSGPELARLLARTHPETAIVYMSGYAEEAVLTPGIRGGAASFIAKPFEVGELRAVLQRAVRGAPAAGAGQAGGPNTCDLRHPG
jgi:two-component system cell cycle sensor histidine kinase/response regulator CckA